MANNDVIVFQKSTDRKEPELRNSRPHPLRTGKNTAKHTSIILLKMAQSEPKRSRLLKYLYFYCYIVGTLAVFSRENWSVSAQWFFNTISAHTYIQQRINRVKESLSAHWSVFFYWTQILSFLTLKCNFFIWVIHTWQTMNVNLSYSVFIIKIVARSTFLDRRIRSNWKAQIDHWYPILDAVRLYKIQRLYFDTCCR